VAGAAASHWVEAVAADRHHRRQQQQQGRAMPAPWQWRWPEEEEAAESTRKVCQHWRTLRLERQQQTGQLQPVVAVVI
jgi:hypothetical protein